MIIVKTNVSLLLSMNDRPIIVERLSVRYKGSPTPKSHCRGLPLQKVTVGVLRKHALLYFCYSGKFCFIIFFLTSGIFSDIFSVELRYVCTFSSLSVFFCCAYFAYCHT